MSETETVPSILKLADALAKARLAFDPVIKDADNPHYRSKYATLSSVIESTRKALSDNNLIIIQFPITKTEEKLVGVKTRLIHISSGEEISNELLVPGENRGIFDAQSIGSALTYTSRYSLKTLLGIAEDDDDGNAASVPPQKENRLPPPPPQPPQTTKGKPGRPAGKANPNAAPKANIPPAPVVTEKVAENTPTIAAPPAEKTSSNSTKSEQPSNEKPRVLETVEPATEEQRQGYYTRARVISKKLEESGLLKADASGSVGAQLAKYFFLSSGTDDLKNMTISQWESALSALETTSNETAATLIKEKSVKI